MCVNRSNCAENSASSTFMNSNLPVPDCHRSIWFEFLQRVGSTAERTAVRVLVRFSVTRHYSSLRYPTSRSFSCRVRPRFALGDKAYGAENRSNHQAALEATFNRRTSADLRQPGILGNRNILVTANQITGINGVHKRRSTRRVRASREPDEARAYSTVPQT
jgi:hypothetical protein